MQCGKREGNFMRHIVPFIGNPYPLHSSLPGRLYQSYKGNSYHTSSPARCHLRPHHQYEPGHIPVKLKESRYVGEVDMFQPGRVMYCVQAGSPSAEPQGTIE